MTNEERSFGRFEFNSLEAVRNRLINLSRSNRLINFQDSRAIALADQNLTNLVKRFTLTKDYSLQLFKRLNFAQFQDYFNWLSENEQRRSVYFSEKKFTWLTPTLEAQTVDNKYARENALTALSQEVSQINEEEGGEEFVELSTEEQEFTDLDQDELFADAQNLAQETSSGNARFSLIPYLNGRPLTPEVIIPLLLENEQARHNYLSNRDPQALIPEILEKSINLASYAQYALGLENLALGLDATNNPEFKGKNSSVQVLGWEAKAGKQLENFNRNNQKSLREIGAGILYLTVGLIEYLDNDKTNCFAPLYLIPVNITDKSNRRGQIVISYTGEDIIENVSLAEKLRNDFGVYLPRINVRENLWQESKKLELGISSPFTAEQIQATFANANNDDTYSFVEYLALVEQSFALQKFEVKIHQQAFLATYLFAKQRMYLDLNPEEWPSHARLEDNNLINALFNEKTGDKDFAVGQDNTEYDIDNIANIHELYPLLDEADSSQHSALIDVMQGKNLVIEGPPGSGKSQTITNMIAAAMKQGKKVLFVAEKQAAQEGVYRRLIDLGLGDFCLDLHDTHIAKKAVFESIERRLDSLGFYTYPEGLPNAIAQYEQYKNILNAYSQQINANYANSGFSNQEILAAAGYYKQFNFANGGLGLFDAPITEDANRAAQFFTRDNYDNIIHELNSFTTVISKLRESLILQSRYLRQTQQEQDPIMAMVAKAQVVTNQDVSMIKGLNAGGFSLGGRNAQRQVNLNDAKIANLRIRDHLWYGVSSRQLNVAASGKVIQALYNWQKSLVEIKDFVQTLLRTHQIEPEAVLASGELAPSGADAQDLELAHLDLLALDIFAKKFASLPLTQVNDFVDLNLLRRLLVNPLEPTSLFNALQHDLEHLERFTGFSASQGQGLFNYAYLDCLVQQNRYEQTEFSKVTLVPELRAKYYSIAERQRLLRSPEVERLFAHLLTCLPQFESQIQESGNLASLNRLATSLESYLKCDSENQKSANEFLNYLTSKLSGTLELNYQQLVDLAQLLSQLPANLVKYRSINYLSPVLETNFKELDESLSQLRYEIESLQMDFDLGHLASYEEFVEMRKALINKPNFIARLFNSSYKNARRRFLLLTRGIDYDDIAVERILARIDSYYAKLRMLENSQSYKDFFGSLYQGAQTNLEHVRTLCDWTNKVADYCRNKLHNSQVSPVLTYLLSEEEFFAVVEIGRVIESDFHRLREAEAQVNSYLKVPLRDYSQLSNLAQSLLPEIQILTKLVKADFKVVDLQTTLQDGLALFHEQAQEQRFSSGLISEAQIEQLTSFDAALSDLHAYLVNHQVNNAISQRLYQEHPSIIMTANTWYLAQQFIGLARLLGELKSSNMQAIAGNVEQVSDLQKQSQVGLSLKEVLRIARMQQTQTTLNQQTSLNITARGILSMFEAFNSFADFIQAQEKMASLSSSIKNARQTFAEFVSLTALQDNLWIGESTNSLLDLIVRNQLALDCADGLIEWIDYLKATQSLLDLGIGKISNYAEQVSNLTTTQLANMFSQVFFNYLAWKVIEQSPVLRDFSSINHNAIVEKFDQADENLKYLQRLNTAYAIDVNTKTVAGVESKRPAALTEMALLRYVVNHKNMRASLRDVIFRAGTSLQALKPCFMMSPASVAQFLTPGSLSFDLMIMDEASQVTPEDALGAIARSKQVVIVGDPKQLPPTNFFSQSRATSENDEGQLITQTAKSILDVATTMFPTRVLRWHYRSRHESLIAFSNQQYYGAKLIAFPSPYAQHPDFGIKFHKVEGTFHYQRANPLEAKVVAQAMIEQLLTHPDETLGAVAMNQRQATLIEREFNKLLEANPKALDIYQLYEGTVEPVFVKNLENVQGDERDVIFISCTYAPAKLGGNLPQRFGPVNAAGGSKRLNVLFTRSKKRMEIFSSFTYQEVKEVTESRDSGVNDLRAFLKYAQTGILPHARPVQGQSSLSTANYISRSLVEEIGDTYEVNTQIGVASYRIDMAFAPKGSSTYILGLETDGQTYASAKSARDRDRLRSMVLRRLGWNIERIWTVDWYKYSQQEITADLKNMLEQLG